MQGTSVVIYYMVILCITVKSTKLMIHENLLIYIIELDIKLDEIFINMFFHEAKNGF